MQSSLAFSCFDSWYGQKGIDFLCEQARFFVYKKRLLRVVEESSTVVIKAERFDVRARVVVEIIGLWSSLRGSPCAQLGSQEPWP